MDMQNQDTPIRPNPRRRRRSKLQIFKEAYLPVIILVLAAILIVTFIVGAIARATQSPNGPQAGSSSSTSGSSGNNQGPQPSDPGTDPLLAEVQQLLARAEAAANIYDYTGALAILDTFSGNIAHYPELANAYNHYRDLDTQMVTWSASQVPNLSFHLLIADPNRAFTDASLGTNYRRNFITTYEFSAILQQLYDNGYVLVDLDTLYTTEFNTSSGRDVYKEIPLRLPAGKKPIMLTEVNVSYYGYMVDSNGDGKPDAGGDGFASKLCYGENGFYNEIVLADGSSATGAYDMVPLLESFIQAHPDFSYRGARATVAFTGSDGILGYRGSQLSQAAPVVQALRDSGYTLACYTYDNLDYGAITATQLQNDIQSWTQQVTSLVGQLDVLVFARDSDIGNTDPYDGSKFTILHNTGFRFFMGVSSAPWNQVEALYVRHNRLMVTGSNLTGRPELFAGLFDAASVLDPARP